MTNDYYYFEPEPVIPPPPPEYGDYSVYIHILKGKIYVGYTTDRERRWNHGYGYHHNRAFYADIKRYGWNHVTHVIDSESLSLRQAKARTLELIAEHDSTNPEKGYNSLFSERLAHHNSPEQIALRKAACPLRKRVEQYDLHGNLIATYDSLSDAAKAVGIGYNAISAHLHGKAETSGGFKWKFTT